MSKIVEIGEAILYHGDCREIMLKLQADALIIDPVWPNAKEGLLQGGDNPYRLFQQICSAMPQVKRLAIILRNDSDPRFLSAVPKEIPFIVVQLLQYAIPHYNGRKLGGIEFAYGFGEPIKSKPGRRCIGGVSRKVLPQERENVGHPCSRNLAHMEFVVNWWSDEGETVLDPCMGSGTTGVACERLTAIQDQKKLFASIDG